MSDFPMPRNLGRSMPEWLGGWRSYADDRPAHYFGRGDNLDARASCKDPYIRFGDTEPVAGVHRLCRRCERLRSRVSA